MSAFDDFATAFKAGLPKLIQQTVSGFAKNATDDATTFLDDTKADVTRWLQMLADGQLSKREFADLVHGRQSLAVMASMTEAGVALATVQRFRDGVIDLAVNSAFAALKI